MLHLITSLLQVHTEYEVDDDDSMAQLVDYSSQHDAVLEFYYTNEQTNVCDFPQYKR